MRDRHSDAYRDGQRDFRQLGRIGYDRDRYDGFAWTEDENYTVGFDEAKHDAEYERRQEEEREEREQDERIMRRRREEQWAREAALEEERRCEEGERQAYEEQEREAIRDAREERAPDG